MRVLSRTPLATGQPSGLTVLDHLRLTFDDLDEANRMITAARLEIEQYAGIAFFHTTVVALSQPEPGIELRLPVGPLAADPSVMAYAVAEDGIETEITPANIIPGAHPEIILASAPAWRVRVTYRAGFGSTPEDVPDDLWHAVMDQALRLYDRRGDMDDKPGLVPSAARISARYTRVSFA